VALLLLALQVSVFCLNLANRGQPVMGMRLEDHLMGQLGGDFKQRADALIDDYENKNITVSVAEHTSGITLRQLGVTVNKEHIHNSLLSEGRTGDILARLSDQDLVAFGGRDLSLGHPYFNTEAAKAYIALLDQKIDVPPANAYFAFQNQQVVVHPDSKGRAIDADIAVQLLGGVRPEADPRLTLPIKQVPAAIDTSVLSPLLPEVQSIAQKPLAIVAGGSRTTLSPEQLVALVVPKVTPSPSDPNKLVAQITFDEAKLNALVDATLGPVVVVAKPTIMSGNKIIKQGVAGVQAEDSHGVARVLAALLQRQTGAANPDEVQIPLVSISPPVVQQASQGGASVNRGTGSGAVHLTFDDGPGYYTDQILDILKRYNVHATFYVVGRNVSPYSAQMQRMVSEGHRVGNHTFNHANLTLRSRAGVLEELQDTQEAVRNACGVTPSAFRPPYGAVNAAVRDVAGGLGLSVNLWSVDPRDWAQPGSSVIAQRVLDDVRPGAVVLLHVLHQQTVSALPSIIEGIRARGYTL
jgi:peptidoglycan/xylan/chitin deacetylase (PgdA/CDA1 family)